MDFFTLLITISVVILAATLVPLAIFLMRTVEATGRFFEDVAKRYHGRARRFPPGAVYALEQGLQVKLNALQGNIIYRARISLPEDPGILVTLIFRWVKFLDKLNYSFGRQRTRYQFAAPIDEQYMFRAIDGPRLREIFQPDLVERMRTQGRVTRLEIRRNRFRGALMMVSFTPGEVEKAEQSIEILNDVLRRVARR